MADAICASCGEQYNGQRKALGYATCLACGDAAARSKRHCVVPLHKSNYIFISPGDFGSLRGMNCKGGNVR